MTINSSLSFILILFCVSFFSQHLRGQNRIEYRFNNNFSAEMGAGPDLIPICTGQFQPETQYFCNETVYRFDFNCGLTFDNTAADNFIDDEYTVEMYFRFETLNSWKRILDFKNRASDWGLYGFDGRVNFYNIVTSANAPFTTDRYAHILVARQASSQEFQVYVDGLEYISFPDVNQEAVLGPDNLLSFFQDDLVVQNEASAGEIALLRIYDYVLTPDEVFESFSNIRQVEIDVSICAGTSYFAGGREQSVSGSYSDTLLTAQGCDSIVLTHLQVLPPLRDTVRAQICFGDDYEGYTEAGIYQDSFTSAQNCDSLRVLELSVSEGVLTNLTAEICAGDSYTLGDTAYTQTGVYQADFPRLDQCDSLVILSLTVNELPTVVINSLTDYNGFEVSCPGGYDAVLEAEGRGGSPPFQYQWSTGVVQKILEGLTSGNYRLSLTDAAGCGAEASLEIGSPPEYDLSVDVRADACPGESGGELTATAQGLSGPFLYTLNDDAFQTNPLFSGLAYGTYRVRAQDVNGCEQQRTVLLEAPPTLSITFPAPFISINLGDSVALNPTTDFPIDTFYWEPAITDCKNCFSPVVRPSASTTYALTAISSDGCAVQAEVEIAVNVAADLFVPSAFSPNEDGENDYFNFFARGSVARIVSFQVFNRWGALVFEEKDFPPNTNQGWDGRREGRLAEAGVFIYQIIYETKDGRREERAGDLALLR